jgi:hypothetical protein
MSSTTNLRINSDTGAAEQGVRAPRLTLWIAFLLFSIITLGASVEVVRLSKNAPLLWSLTMCFVREKTLRFRACWCGG